MYVSIRLKIKTMYNNFSQKEKGIADYILENSSTVAHSSISTLADTLGVADSTLFQFAKKLGYNGFKDFKMAMLIQEKDFSAITIHENINQSDTELMMAQKVFDSNITTLNDTKQLLNQNDLKTAVDLINSSNRLFLFGVGGSEIVATDAYHKFLRSSISVFHSTDYHLQLMESSIVTPNDCAILISHTGKSKETIHLAKTVSAAGAKTIVITSQVNSPLAELGDIVFTSVAEETEFRSEALASRISQLSIIDSLYVILMFYNQEIAYDSISKIRRTIADSKEQ